MSGSMAELQAAFDAGKSPGELGFVMPIETDRHAGCFMAWPHDDHTEVWGKRLSEVQANHARIAEAIAAFEPVTVVTHPDEAMKARAAHAPSVQIVEIPQGDLWFRDTGPLFVKDADGQIAATNLVFNNWGEKFPDYEDDAAVGEALARHLGVPVWNSPLVGEGGGIHVDGRGTAITTETFLLNANRNPGLSRAEVERELFRALGVTKTIWLPGDDGEWITDGHIDGMLTFCGPGKVLFETNPDTENPRHRVCAENLKALQGQSDATGAPIEIGLIEEAHRVTPTSEFMALSYVNNYIANGGVVIPHFDTPTDLKALETFQRAYPDRRIAPVNVLAICPGGGGVHCITQQRPA